MTEIHYIDDHGFWRREYGITGQIEIMHHMLKNRTLDPTFLKYGGFYEYDPLNTQDKPLYTPGTTFFWGNFYDASCAFRFASDEPEVVAPMIKAIEDNIASDRFIAAKVAQENNLQAIRELNERRERQQLKEERRKAMIVLSR